MSEKTAKTASSSSSSNSGQSELLNPEQPPTLVRRDTTDPQHQEGGSCFAHAIARCGTKLLRKIYKHEYHRFANEYTKHKRRQWQPLHLEPRNPRSCFAIVDQY